MKIEYDTLYKQYVVWKIEGRGWFEIYKSKLKKDCKEFVKKYKKENKKNGKRNNKR